jgi:hypothetical protein
MSATSPAALMRHLSPERPRRTVKGRVTTSPKDIPYGEERIIGRQRAA